MNFRKTLFLIGFGLLAGSAANDCDAQQLPHSFARPDLVKVTHLHLDVQADFQAQTLIGTATLTLERKNESSELRVDTRELAIEKVTDEHGNALKWNLLDEQGILGRGLSIELGEQSTKVIITYETSPSASALQWLTPEQTTDKQHPFLFTQSQAILARTWVPCQDTPAVRMTYSAKVQVPAELMAVMSASNPQSKNDSGIYEFQMQQPIPSYLLALAVGDLQFMELGSRSGVYAEPSVVKRAHWELNDVERMIAAAEELYGPYRWDRYDVIFLPASFPFGGMENPRLTFATPTILAGDRSLVALIAHELAHSWSGNLVTNSTWNDFWLNEGFTVYFEQRIMESLYGREYSEMLARLSLDALKDEIRQLDARDTWLKLDLRGRDPDDGMTSIAYDKGYFFLRMLEEKVGRDKWDGFLRSWFDKHAFQSMDTEQFLLFLNQNLQVEVDLEQWVYQPGLPENAPTVKTQQLANARAAAQAFLAGQSADQLPTDGWTTHHWNHFLRTFRGGLKAQQMQQLDDAFRFTQSGNSEITHDWLMLVIESEFQPGFGKLETFLTGQGRRKFVEPLFEQLAHKNPSLAKQIYAKARSGYHAVTRQTVDKILNFDARPAEPDQASSQQELQDQLLQRKAAFQADPNNADNLIWYGRFLAYAGQYQEAIELFAKGAKQFPGDARMLRHRGHRLISIRKFDEAISDLEKAASLIGNQKDQVEPDGMPNDQGVPVSTLHTNVWYHLGLAYYLKHDFGNALRCYTECRNAGSNNDNLVSSTHWLYMIHRRLGNEQAAIDCLQPIGDKLKVIENRSYYLCCRFYQGRISLQELLDSTETGPARSAIDYAVGNWHLYGGDEKVARNKFQELLAGESKTAFGFIAAESDLKSLDSNE